MHPVVVECLELVPVSDNHDGVRTFSCIVRAFSSSDTALPVGKVRIIDARVFELFDEFDLFNLDPTS